MEIHDGIFSICCALTRALRPEGIEWTDHEPGRPSFRLEHLTAANGIAHEAAHDALSDVTATIAMAKLVKQKQPRLFDYVVNHRSKKVIADMLNLEERKPFFHISGMLSRANMYGAIMMPLAKHPTNSNGIICVDLSADPELLMGLEADEIAHRVFTASDDLSKGEDRIPLKVIHVNKAPVVATHKLIDGATAKRLNLNVDRCEEHWRRLNQVDLATKLRSVFSERTFTDKTEAEQRLYDGFLPNSDRPILDEVRNATSENFTQQRFHFSDNRYNQLLVSYRARYFSDSLTEQERQSWIETCRWRLTDASSGYITVEQLSAEVNELLSGDDLTEQQRTILESLIEWTKNVDDEFSSSN